MTSPTPSPTQPARDLPAVGDELQPLELAFTRETLVRYAGASGDFNPIHYSDAHAREVGLDGVIAHGMLTMGAAIEVVTRWAGDPAAIRSYQVRFSRQVPVPDGGAARPHATARVTGVDPATRDVTVALTVTVDGAKVLGKAVATVRLP